MRGYPVSCPATWTSPSLTFADAVHVRWLHNVCLIKTKMKRLNGTRWFGLGYRAHAEVAKPKLGTNWGGIPITYETRIAKLRKQG